MRNKHVADRELPPDRDPAQTAEGDKPAERPVRRRRRSRRDSTSDDWAPGRRWLRVAISGLVLAACGWKIATDTAAFTLARTDPEAALDIDGGSATALVGLGEQQLAKAKDAAEIDAATGLAEAALSANPLEARAIRLLAFAADVKGEDGRAVKLMQSASARTRRDVAVEAWLFDRAVEAGDASAALDHGDALLRTGFRGAPAIYLPLMRFAADPKWRPTIAERLGQAPPWRGGFLSKFGRESEDPAAAVALLDELAKGPNPPKDSEIKPLVDTLVQRRDFDLAYLVWVHFLPDDRRQSLPYVYNGDFELPATQLPFDWTLIPISGASTEIVASPDADRGHVLHVQFANKRVAYRHVNKLLMLTAGHYRLSGFVRAENLETERGLLWRLGCAGNNRPSALAQTPAFKGSLDWQRFQIEFDVPAEDCRAQTLTLLLDARAALEQQIGGDVWFDNIAIDRM
jgi:hypothetical protein